MVTSVLCSDSVLLWLPELLREGLGRVADAIFDVNMAVFIAAGISLRSVPKAEGGVS
jgi:hypothetical protein